MKKRMKTTKSKMNKRNSLILCGIIFAIIVLSGGIFVYRHFKSDGSKDVRKEEGTPIEDIINTKPKEEVKKVKIVDENSKSRPFAVMINNISTARPYQSGLQDAYIIYEMIVEGGITRFLALFKDQKTERIGTVRSSRHYYLDYALENDAYYVHWGWSPQAESDIKSLKIQNVNGLYYSNKYFWKDKSLPVATEHTAYTSISKLEDAVSDLKYRRETNKGLLLNYSAEEIDVKSIDGASAANNVSIKYSNSLTSSYSYDPELKVYYRSINGNSHVDYVTKKQYTFKNIITYQIKNSNISGDEKGRQNFNNIGSGTGYYISDGYAVPIKWEKKSREAQTKYYFLDGKELIVNDGNTFIQIQPKGLDLNID